MLVLAPLLVWGPLAAGVSPDDCARIYQGIGKPASLTSRPTTLLCRKGYILSFNHGTRVADWVMERLTAPA